MAEIKGSYTALVTPFRDGKVDEKAFADFVEWQISEGSHGLVPCGTTGESPTLSHAEHHRVVELCIEVAKGRVQVMAGTGSNSTEEAIEFIRHAEKAGADSALVVAPYYNKPTQEGLYRHYKAIHDASGLPIVIYNIPGRSVINITDDTLARLAELPRIAGVKDATGDLARVSTLRRRVGDKLALLSGEDMTAIGFNAQGGQGVISVTSNIMPRATATQCGAPQCAASAASSSATSGPMMYWPWSSTRWMPASIAGFSAAYWALRSVNCMFTLPRRPGAAGPRAAHSPRRWPDRWLGRRPARAIPAAGRGG